MLALLLPALPAHARVHRSGSWADAQFAAAQQLQQALEARPLETRTRHDYERVIYAYRRVYLGAPSAGRADPSVVAAAQMTEEMGRRFNDPDILRSAIQQYEFLRSQYPGSKNRFDALFRIGEIYKDDLHDKARSNATFNEFLHRYPRNQFAEAARQALAEPAQPANLRSKDAIGAAKKNPKPTPNSGSEASSAQDNSIQNNSATTAESTYGKPSRVIGIRHWSAPDYTRVAIDLEQDVKFQSQRIEHPDRVFFDLFNTQLDAKLAGKTFDVSDSLLKDIRLSQYKLGSTRVVLDLNDRSDFNASLLSNPPRLIIEVHSGEVHSRNTSTQSKENQNDAKEFSADVDLDRPVGKTLLDSIANNADEPSQPTQTNIEKPNRTTVVLDHGVKKTIVEADDEDAVPQDNDQGDKDKDRNKDKADVAKLDPPAADFSPTRPASIIPGARSTSDHLKSGTAKSKRKPSADLDVREAQPTASGDRSLIRALGLKIGKIVIDPGHGGHDTGTIGPNGLEEKDLVLDVSRRLGKLLQTRLGSEVIYTRRDDTFIPLETRTAIANQEAADLFVSVHANSSHDPAARGVETYYLNFTSSPEALEVAARENAVSEKSIHELQDLVKKIALREKIEESQEFASDVQRSLHTGLATKNPGMRDRGVKKAPFIVLIGANMPSILAEISFVSNPGDERRLRTADYRQKIAESLYRGIAKYVSGLSGIKVASKIDKDAAQ